MCRQPSWSPKRLCASYRTNALVQNLLALWETVLDLRLLVAVLSRRVLKTRYVSPVTCHYVTRWTRRH
jgi:hypothetical protein